MDFTAKRRFQRLSRCEAVKLHSPAGMEYATYEDISASGLKLRLDHPFQEGTLVEVDFEWPQTSDASPRPSYKTFGRVIYCRAKPSGRFFLIGVEFVDREHLRARVLEERAIDSQAGPF